SDDFCVPRRQLGAVGCCPDQRVRIEEIAPTHLIYSFHSGPSSSKSSAIQTLPSSAPNKLFFVEAAGGISRATTLPWRVMSTSSPASARLTSSENFALASAIDMFMLASNYDQNLGHNSRQNKMAG